MKNVQKELVALRENMRRIVRPEEAALDEVAKGDGALSLEDMTAIKEWGKEALAPLKEQEKILKSRLAALAAQIKELKERTVA